MAAFANRLFRRSWGPDRFLLLCGMSAVNDEPRRRNASSGPARTSQEDPQEGSPKTSHRGNSSGLACMNDLHALYDLLTPRETSQGGDVSGLACLNELHVLYVWVVYSPY